MSECKLEPDCGENAMDEWIEDRYDEFIKGIKSILKKDSPFIHEVAAAIAWSNFQNDDCLAFLDAHNLNEENVMCYLHSVTDQYFDEVRELYINRNNYD